MGHLGRAQAGLKLVSGALVVALAGALIGAAFTDEFHTVEEVREGFASAGMLLTSSAALNEQFWKGERRLPPAKRFARFLLGHPKRTLLGVLFTDRSARLGPLIVTSSTRATGLSSFALRPVDLEQGLRVVREGNVLVHYFAGRLADDGLAALQATLDGLD